MTRWVWPEVSPLRHSALRERLKYQASPLAMVLRSASSFICATIRTSPVTASVATQVTRPDSSKRGWKASPSSRSMSSLDVDMFGNRHGQVSRAVSRINFARLPLPSHHGQETRLLRRVVAEHAGEAAGEGRRTVLGNAAYRHAGMLGLDHDRNATRLEDLVDRGRDLRGQMLLGLQAAGKDVGEACQLGEPDHPFDRRIGDMRLAIERHHVVLALRRELDVADQHEIVVAGGLAEGAVEHLGRAQMIALIKFVEGLHHASRRVQQSLATGVLADIAEQRLYRGFRLGARRPRLVGADGRGQKLGWVQFGRTHIW